MYCDDYWSQHFKYIGDVHVNMESFSTIKSTLKIIIQLENWPPNIWNIWKLEIEHFFRSTEFQNETFGQRWENNAMCSYYNWFWFTGHIHIATNNISINQNKWKCAHWISSERDLCFNEFNVNRQNCVPCVCISLLPYVNAHDIQFNPISMTIYDIWILTEKKSTHIFNFNISRFYTGYFTILFKNSSNFL